MKKVIIEALEARYNAEIAEAEATIKIYLENSVGIGEHPQHLEEVDKQVQKIADAQEKLEVLQGYKLWSEGIVKNMNYLKNGLKILIAKVINQYEIVTGKQNL